MNESDLKKQYRAMGRPKLADTIGALHGAIKQLEVQLELAKDEFKRRHVGEIYGSLWAVSLSQGARSDIDRAAVEKALGKAWVEKHTRKTFFPKVLVKDLQTAAKAA